MQSSAMPAATSSSANTLARLSDNAKLWKLYGEISLWIADLSVAAVFSKHGSGISGDDEDLIVERSSLSEKYRAGQERQMALAKAEEAFQRVKICDERPA